MTKSFHATIAGWCTYGFAGWRNGSRCLPMERRRSRRRWTLESLEARELLSVAPASDYALSGEAWTNPGRITFSFAPDGVWWDHGTNGIHAAFNAKFGTGTWQRQIALALAT